MWQMTHGGVETHHLLAQRNMPGFSNWWGLAIVPLIAALPTWSPKAVMASAGAFLAGVAMSIAFIVDRSGNAAFYVMLGVLACGFIFRTYRPEYYFGYIVGLSVAFGLVIPALISPMFMAISAAFHLLVRPGFIWTLRRGAR
jgi:hypothetical protein